MCSQSWKYSRVASERLDVKSKRGNLCFQENGSFVPISTAYLFECVHEITGQ